MITARLAIQRPRDARLLVVDATGRLTHAPRARWPEFVRRGDLVVANDAATLPASLAGTHERTGQPVELRLAAWRSPIAATPFVFDAVVFGAGDWRTRTEDRPVPPPLLAGDRLVLGPLTPTVHCVLAACRLVRVSFDVPPARFWRGLAMHGRAVQYAHLEAPLALWDAWTPIAATPVAFESPSAGFMLDWREIAALRARGIGFATLTHAAGLSSTGDATLDRRLPLDERYRVPEFTVTAIGDSCAGGARVIAIGTTVVRALEHAAAGLAGLHAGEGVATGRVGPKTPLRVVDAVVTGTHEPGTSHHELLRAFASDETLARAARALEQRGYRTHEFGDSMLVFADPRASTRRERYCDAAAA